VPQPIDFRASTCWFFLLGRTVPETGFELAYPPRSAQTAGSARGANRSSAGSFSCREAPTRMTCPG
jgi:hypothetical protein